jgi:hypothetical protein
MEHMVGFDENIIARKRQKLTNILNAISNVPFKLK